MSTKTTLKRIALVAVSALGFGLLSVAPSNAAALSSAGIVPSAANVTIGTTGSATSRFTFTNGDAGETVVFSVSTAATATTGTWRILEHSNDITFNAYQGNAGNTTTMTVGTGGTSGSTYFLIQFNTVGATSTATYALQSKVGVAAAATEVTYLALSAATITNKSLTTNVATLTTSAAHGFTTGDLVTVTGVDSTFNGTYTVASTPTATTFTYAVTAANVTSVTSTGSAFVTLASTDTPWRINDSYTGETTTVGSLTNAASMSAASSIATTTNDVRIISVGNTTPKAGTGSYRYVEVTGSTIKAVAGNVVMDGAANTATRALVNLNGTLGTTAEVHINATTAGTITVKFVDRSQVAITGAFYDTVLQTITYTVSAANTVSTQQSKSYIHAIHNKTNGIATDVPTGYSSYAGDFSVIGDMSVLAVATADGTNPKAVIQVQLKDAAGAALLTSALPSVGATITGPGTLSISGGAAGAASKGVSLSETVAPSSTFYINVFSDGISGASKVSILVGGAVWGSEELTFYSPTVAAIKATQGRFVLAAGETAGCVSGLTTCLGTTVANSVATSIQATDANGSPVPFVTYTETSSDATVLTGNATANAGDFAADYVGTTWFQVPAVANAASGKSATMTYTAGTLTQVLTFSIGGAPATASLAIAAGANVGEKGKFTVTVKDASGNPIADSDHTLAVTSNLYLVIPASNALPVKSGSASVDFWNPTVPGTVNVTGLITGVLPVSGSFSVSNASVDAAADAAAEAIDAANAATDAANLAAEAADAATVAAEEARDAADAATAAVEELATQVATLMAALKAQITTLANTVAKIAKKVKVKA